MTFSSQHHSFDIVLATKYGIEEAILIHHFQHWIRINRGAGRNIKDGKCWMYQTRKEMKLNFPYWTYETVKYLCEKLVIKGILITGNFNKKGFDRTMWYAFVDEKAFAVDEEFSKNLYQKGNFPNGEGKVPNGLGKSPSPIPDTKTDTKTTNEEKKKYKIKRIPASESATSLENYFFVHLKKIKNNFKEPDHCKWAQEFDEIMNEDGRTEEEIKKVIDDLYLEEFWSGIILSPKCLRKNFDKVEIAIKKSNAKNIINKNKNKVLEFKERNIEVFHDLNIKGIYAVKENSGKEISLMMNPEAFEAALISLYD